MPVPNEELLKWFGTEMEKAERLGDQAALAEQFLGIHGVSVTARETSAPARRQKRSEVEPVFPVHETPSRRDPFHRTIELPKPVTREIAEQFNDLFRDGS